MCEQFQMGELVLPYFFCVVIDAIPWTKFNAAPASAGYRI
jgi:hypothetical protein